MLRDGQPRSDFTGGTISGGMFFSGDNHEPLNAGYDYVDNWSNIFVNSRMNAKMFNEKALAIVDAGNKVVVGFERMAIGGLEGHITMFAKLKESS